MAHPVGSREQFGRDGDQRRGTPVERAPRVGVVAADDLDRRQHKECAGAQAELRKRILLGRGAAAQQRRLLQGHLRGVDGVTGVTDRRAIRDAQQRIARRREGCWAVAVVACLAAADCGAVLDAVEDVVEETDDDVVRDADVEGAPRASPATRSLG